MYKRIALVATLSALATGSAHAEFFGLLNGRTADTDSFAPLSVEGAFITSDDYQNIGARVNYKVSPTLVVFGDVGLLEFGSGLDDSDGLGFGVGAFFHLVNQQIMPQLDVGAKGSFHFADFDGEGGRSDFDGNNISVEVLVSGKETLGTSGLNWYANGGLNVLGGDFDENELLLGGGVYLPAGPGEVYAGADLIDDLQFGIGYRYSLR